MWSVTYLFNDGVPTPQLVDVRGGKEFRQPKPGLRTEAHEGLKSIAECHTHVVGVLERPEIKDGRSFLLNATARHADGGLTLLYQKSVLR